jgi:tetratricopeptide (TPR) repeat protein
VASEIAEALQEAHARRFLHRDLKPANIMLTEQGHIKIMDFGLAKRLAEPSNLTAPPSEDDATRERAVGELTAPGAFLGTPSYMSPEQVKGLALDERSDVFSLGVILAEMTLGRHPFRKSSTLETLSAVLRDPPDLSGEMPQALLALVRRMLAKSKEERYASMAEVRADLGRLASAPEALGSGGATAPRVPLIGRDAEFKQLTKALEDALAGRGSMILIGGEPGIGKTHLTTALLEGATLRGALALTGHCYEMEGSPPYVPFIETLEYCARNLAREGLRRALGDDAAEVSRLMPELRQVFPDIPKAIELPPEQQRRFLFNAYRSFLERATRGGPIVVLFEDLHWADEPTLALLQHITQGLSGMRALWIGTYRDVDLDTGRPFAKTLEMLLRQKLATRISLRRLPVAGVEEMLAALSAQKPPPSLARVVFEETEGNPFFVEEVFRHLAEEGKLFDEQGAFRPGLKVDQLQVPEGVRLVLGRRLDRLSDDARRILTTGAIIGRIFPLELLEDLEKARPDAALEAVEEAERAHLVEPVHSGRQARYRFVHELVRQTLTGTLSLPRRQRLHARVAESLERVYRSSLDAHASALAHHLYQAGAAADQDKSIHFLSEAATKAIDSAAHEEALEQLDRALSLLEEEKGTLRAADLQVRRGGVLRSLSRTQEALQEYERALNTFEALGESERAVAACAGIVWIHGWAANFKDGAVAADRAVRNATSASASTRFSALCLQALSKGGSESVDEGLEILDELLKTPEHELTPWVAARVGVMEATIRHHAGQYALAEVAARKAIPRLEKIGDLWGRADLVAEFIAPLYLGQPQEAKRRILEAIPRAARLGHDNAKYIALAYMPGVHVAAGDLHSAEQAAREALAFGEACNAGWVFAGHSRLGTILLFRGHREESLSRYEEAVRGPATYVNGLAEGQRAFAMVALGHERAREACDTAMGCLPRLGTSRSMGSWMAVLSLTQALCLSGRQGEAASLQVEAEKIALEWVCGGSTPARTAAGIAAACARDWPRAEEHHRAAIARMDEIPDLTAQCIARYWYADMLAERGGQGDLESARALLNETIAKSEAIGLALFARLARERLSRLSA